MVWVILHTQWSKSFISCVCMRVQYICVCLGGWVVSGSIQLPVCACMCSAFMCTRQPHVCWISIVSHFSMWVFICLCVCVCLQHLVSLLLQSEIHWCLSPRLNVANYLLWHRALLHVDSAKHQHHHPKHLNTHHARSERWSLWDLWFLPECRQDDYKNL